MTQLTLDKIMEETFDLQKRQVQTLLSRLEQSEKEYNEQIQRHTEILRDQYKETLRECIQQQSRKYADLEETCLELKQELIKVKDQSKIALDRALERQLAEFQTKQDEKRVALEQTLEEERKQLVSLKERMLKQSCTISLQKQQLTDQTIEHSSRLVQIKKFEETVQEQTCRIEDLQRKLKEQKEYTDILENKITVLNDRLKTLNVPEDFVEKEKQMLSEIKILERKHDMAQRNVENWQNKYKLLETQMSRRRVGR